MEEKVKKLNNEGVKYFLKGHFGEARKKYLEALEIIPVHPATLNNLGMVLLQEKKFSEAEKLFFKASQQKENSTYHLNLGHAYANQKKNQKAEACYLKSIHLKPDALMAWKSLATLYQFQKNYYKSVETWEHICKNINADPSFKIQWAKDLMALGEHEKALERFSEVIGHEQYQEQGWYSMGLIHFKKNNFGMAEKSIKKVLAINPDHEASRMLAAVVYLGTSQLDKALFHWNYLLRLNENNHKVRTDKAVALLANGFKKEALTELNRVLLHDKDNPKALYYKALTNIEMKVDLHEAAQILKQLQSAKNPFSRKAAGLLSKMKDSSFKNESEKENG